MKLRELVLDESREFHFELGYQVFLMNRGNLVSVYRERAMVGFRRFRQVLD